MISWVGQRRAVRVPGSFTKCFQFSHVLSLLSICSHILFYYVSPLSLSVHYVLGPLPCVISQIKFSCSLTSL